MHLLALMFFYRIKPMHIFIMQLVNIVLTIVIIHGSGGISSPFTPVMICLLLADFSLGIDIRGGLTFMLLLYIGMVTAEFFGILPQHDVSAGTIYASPLFTVLVALATIGFLAVSITYEKNVVVDLRKKVQLEFDEKEKYRQQIIKMDRMYQLGYLTARVAHDIRSPITVIKGVLQSLQLDFNEGGETHTIIENAVGEVRRMEGLIGNLSGFVRPGHGKKMLFPLNEVIDRVIVVSQMGRLNKVIRFIKGYDPRVSTMVFGCPEEIQQVFFNLLKNSIEAIESGSAEKGLLMVDLEPGGGSVNVSIADNGCGISAERIQEISNDFHSSKQTGWGLGMGIVRDILASHRTRLDISSTVGKGTSLSFSLSTQPFETDF